MLRLNAVTPGAFIRDHLAATGADYTGAIFKAYKKYLRGQGVRFLPSRDAMNKYMFMARRLGLIQFESVQAIERWGNIENLEIEEPETGGCCPPGCPSPRHYYRIVNPADPRWDALEQAYRGTLGGKSTTTRPPVPTEATEPSIEPPVTKKPKKPRKPKVVREPVENFSEKMEAVRAAIRGLAKAPSPEGVASVAGMVANLRLEMQKGIRGRTGKDFDVMNALNDKLSHADDYLQAVGNALTTLAGEKLVYRQKALINSVNASLAQLVQL